MEQDVIDTLAGIEPGSALDRVRQRRPGARKEAQASYRALFTPDDFAGVAASERFALAAFVAGLYGEPATAAFYTAALAQSGPSEALRGAIEAAVAAASGAGPYGRYPAGPLSREDRDGPVYRVEAGTRATLGPRLAAGFEHMHVLALHPRDAAPADLQALLDAGWSTADIVTISQIAAFLSFQIRVVAGLRTLAAAG